MPNRVSAKWEKFIPRRNFLAPRVLQHVFRIPSLQARKLNITRYDKTTIVYDGLQHHVGCHYGDLTRYLAPMINLSCEKYDSAHRIIVKKNLTTTQSRFYTEHVIERVYSMLVNLNVIACRSDLFERT